MRRVRIAASWVLLVAVGCAGGPDAGPPTVHYGQDLCAECGMIVTEERFASAVIAPEDGALQAFVFDDLGCLFAWEGGHAPDPIEAYWVQDVLGAGWFAAETAWYVRGSEIRSPMGSGIASCATREGAMELSRSRDGELLDWSQLRDLARKESLLTPPPGARGT